MTRRFLLRPRLALFVALIWLALVNEVTMGSLVMGLVLGLVLPALTGPFWPDAPRLGRPRVILEYFAVVAWDIVLANLQVTRLILLVPRERLRSAFVTVPLDLASPEAITVLAGTITMTPGTLSADLSADGRSLLVHCLETSDPDGTVSAIKSRYERRLMRIFA